MFFLPCQFIHENHTFLKENYAKQDFLDKVGISVLYFY